MNRTVRQPVWSVKAASVEGASHRRANLPCQDASCWQQWDGQLLAAVADGAGSAAQAGMGANVAATAAVKWLADQRHRLPSPHKRALWRPFFQEAFDAAVWALEAAASEQQAELSDLATTLILLVGTSRYVAAAQIGDGAVVIADPQAEPFALTTPRCGEYVNETVFLHSKAAIEHAQVNLWPGRPTSLAMLTDGLQMLALNLPEGRPHAPFFDPLWQFANRAMTDEEAARQLGAFLQSPRITARADDDLTLLLASLNDPG